MDVACDLLETCGRFLYRSPATTIRMGNMLDILMRLKNVKNLDPRHNTLVENAYYVCKPPERSAQVSKSRPPLHQYIRKLLFTDLDKSSVDDVLRQLCKLPWSECESYLMRCFMKIHKGNYSQVHLIASLTSGLSRYHDEFAVAVVDEVLEEIRLGLELNDYSLQQRRIAHMRLLGELYNYEHIDSSVIFETLHLVLVFGHGTSKQDVLDPPEDCFRIRMVVTLLQTCGNLFDGGSSQWKLDRFLVYFQRYILSKGSIPVDVEFDLQDLFTNLRPNMTRYLSIEEATVALAELEEDRYSIFNNKTGSEMHSGTKICKLSEKTTTISSPNGPGQTNGFGENGRGHKYAVGDTESVPGSSSVNVHRCDNEDKLENRDDENVSGVVDDDGGRPVASNEDDVVQVRHKVIEVDPQEEADFERDFRALMRESLDSRRSELRTRTTLNMVIPMNVFVESTRDCHGQSVEGYSRDEILKEDGGRGSKEVCVKVLVKRGSKQQTKQLFIPCDCSLVQSTKQNEAAELEEKQNIKRLIFDYNDSEEEEINEVKAQLARWIETGRSRSIGHGSTRDGTVGEGTCVRYRWHNRVLGGGGLLYGRRR